MEQAFSNSKEYKLLENNDDAYEKAYEKFQLNYEQWPVMRRRMASGK